MSGKRNSHDLHQTARTMRIQQDRHHGQADPQLPGLYLQHIAPGLLREAMSEKRGKGMSAMVDDAEREMWRQTASDKPAVIARDHQDLPAENEGAS